MKVFNLKGTHIIGLFVVLFQAFGIVNGQSKWDCCTRGNELCPAQPCCDDCGFFVGAELLYWNVCQANLDYAVDGRDDALQSPFSVISQGGGIGPGKMHFMDYDWDTGFRLIAGWRFGCDGWDATAIYTYYHATADGSATANDATGGSFQMLEATLLSADARLEAQNAEEASASNSLDYDVLDVLLSRPYCISRTLITRPYFGVRAVWMHQNLQAKYIGGEVNGESPPLISGDDPRKVTFSSDWEGVGLHAGVETSIRLFSCFNLYGNVSGSILAGRSSSHNKQTGFDSGNSQKLILDIKEDECTALPGYHLDAGINWEYQWCNTCIVLNLGYEMNQWLHTPQIRRFNGDDQHVGSTSANSGNILLHGITFNTSVYF